MSGHSSIPDPSAPVSAASRVIAGCTGAQAGIVTSGAAAGLTLATAACLAGWDVNRMAALPDTRAMPNRILMARTHRNSYDHAVRLAGATIVDIGHNDRGTGAGVRGLEPWEIEAAIDANTAAFLFVATAETLADLPAVLATVLAQPLDTPGARRAAWRQAIDLLAQHRTTDDEALAIMRIHGISCHTYRILGNRSSLTMCLSHDFFANHSSGFADIHLGRPISIIYVFVFGVAIGQHLLS